MSTGKPLNPFTPNKIFQHPRRIAQWQETGTCMPVVIEFDLTNACDNFCPWCFGYKGLNRQDKKTWHKGNVGQNWTLNEARDMLFQVREFGIKAVTFTGGGEPLVSPICIEAIEYADELGLDVALVTNGNRLNAERSERILKCCTWTRISVDATDAEEYRREHGVGRWDALRKNICEMVRIKNEKGYECTIGIGYLTNGNNTDRVMKFAALGREWGVDYAQFRPMLIGWATKAVDYTETGIVKAIRFAEQEYSTDSYSVLCSEHKYNRIEQGKLKRDYDKCCGHHFVAVIAADHKMYVCCHMRGMEKYCIGDLRQSSLASIWFSKRRLGIDNAIDVHSFDCPPLCRADSFNTILAQIEKPVEHRNFI